MPSFTKLCAADRRSPCFVEVRRRRQRKRGVGVEQNWRLVLGLIVKRKFLVRCTRLASTASRANRYRSPTNHSASDSSKSGTSCERGSAGADAFEPAAASASGFVGECGGGSCRAVEHPAEVFDESQPAVVGDLQSLQNCCDVAWTPSRVCCDPARRS